MSRLALVFLLGACGGKQTPAPVCPTCPEPAPVVEAPKPTPPEREPVAEEPKLPPGVEFSVTLDQNLDKARAAVAKKDYPAARAYFEFILQRYPHSGKVHDVELDLAELQVLEQPVIGGTDDTLRYCEFMNHHPFHPQVVNGEIGCRIAKLQNAKAPCDPKKYSIERRWCRLDYCEQPAAANRPECKAQKP
jgi:hypothetical protein